MRKSVILPYKSISFNRTSDGSVRDLGIEQFPVQKGNININGFPKNDVTILMDLSNSSGVNSSRFEAIASRLNVIRSRFENRNKKLEDLWKEWKPASLQTPAELAAFEEYWVSKYESTNTIENGEVKDPVSDVNKEAAPAASE